MKKQFKIIKKILMNLLEKIKHLMNPYPMSEKSEGKLIRYLITVGALRKAS